MITLTSSNSNDIIADAERGGDGDDVRLELGFVCELVLLCWLCLL